MGNYSKDRLALIAQGIAGGHKLWSYEDTGAIGSVQEAEGFITDGADMGMDTGDYVIIHARNADQGTGPTAVVRGAAVVSVTDTGGSATFGLSVLVGDTS